MIAIEYPDGHVEAYVLEDLIDVRVDRSANYTRAWPPADGSRRYVPDWVTTDIHVAGVGTLSEFSQRPEWFPDRGAQAEVAARRAIEPPR